MIYLRERKKPSKKVKHAILILLYEKEKKVAKRNGKKVKKVL